MSGRQCGFGGSYMAAIDTRDREILEYLHQSEGLDVQSLCDLLGVTRTAVRQRISRLEAAGLIVSELQGQSRGSDLGFRVCCLP